MKIDIDLIKKKSEHNEGLLEELEEIALHQLQIKKIECLNIYCKNLKILLLQNNLIDKIENLKQLKKLEYLNLALNNITVIENLEQCESLKKLDLTLNFIDIMSFEISINNLKSNKNLRELYLMGNPCTKWKYYMFYVINELPLLEYLDGSEIVASQRIKSKQLYKHILASLEEEKKIFQSNPDESFDCIKNRKEIYEEVEKENEKEEAMKKMDSENNIEKKEISSIFTNDGEIRQCNEGHYKFMFDEYSSNKYSFLKLYLPKYLCNSLIEIDLNIHYFRCVVNKKVFQIKFHDPILTDCSKISRKKYTGELCVKMRKENYKKNKIVENKYEKNNGEFLSLKHYNPLCSSDSDSCSSSSSSGSSSSFFKNNRFPFQDKNKKNRLKQRKREKTKKQEREKELCVNSLLNQKREDHFLIQEKERKYYSSILNQLPPLQKIQKG